MLKSNSNSTIYSATGTAWIRWKLMKFLEIDRKAKTTLFRSWHCVQLILILSLNKLPKYRKNMCTICELDRVISTMMQSENQKKEALLKKRNRKRNISITYSNVTFYLGLIWESVNKYRPSCLNIQHIRGFYFTPINQNLSNDITLKFTHKDTKKTLPLISNLWASTAHLSLKAKEASKGASQYSEIA